MCRNSGKMVTTPIYPNPKGKDVWGWALTDCPACGQRVETRKDGQWLVQDKH